MLKNNVVKFALDHFHNTMLSQTAEYLLHKEISKMEMSHSVKRALNLSEELLNKVSSELNLDPHILLECMLTEKECTEVKVTYEASPGLVTVAGPEGRMFSLIGNIKILPDRIIFNVNKIKASESSEGHSFFIMGDDTLVAKKIYELLNEEQVNAKPEKVC